MSIRAGRIGKPSWPVPQTNRLLPKGERALELEVWRELVGRRSLAGAGYRRPR